MNKVKFTLLTAGFVLALAFTFSCSSDKDDPPNVPMSSIGENGSSSSSNPSSNWGSSSSSSGVVTFLSKGNNISSYRTVKICNQTWMAENLNYDVEGSRCIDKVQVGELTSAEIQANCDKYGRFYDWATAMGLDTSCNSRNCASQVQAQHRGICPSGWHIPTLDEWRTLADFARAGSSSYEKLKATSGWNGNGNGTDELGFSALPGGYGSYEDYRNYFIFSEVGSDGNWWSTRVYDSEVYGVISSGFCLQIDSNISCGIGGGVGKLLLSVRCIQDYDVGATPSSCGGDVETPVWLWSNVKAYTVTDGVAGSVSYEQNGTYLSYIDDKHYEYSYSFTMPYNTQTETSSNVGSSQVSGNSSRNGNTSQDVRRQITNITTTIFSNGNTTVSQSDITATSTTVYHEASGLTLSTHSTETGTQNGNPVNNSSETNYTIVSLGMDTYRYTTTGGTGPYYEYKVQNGVTLETKSYTAEGALSSTVIYKFPDNAIIREKIPTFTISSTTNADGTGSYETCEVVSDSPTKLTIRVKTYLATGVLFSQYERTYVKRN